VRMPNEVHDGTDAVKIREPEERPDDGEWVRTPLDPHPERVQPHEFTNELRHGRPPRGVDVTAYLLAPEGQDPEMQERLRCLETNFRKAGIAARHLRYLPDLWASERLPWEKTRFGWHGQVSGGGEAWGPMCGTRTHTPKRERKRELKRALAPQYSLCGSLPRVTPRAPQVTNETYQSIVKARTFDRFGGLWVVPQAARRKRTDFEVALATQLAASEAEQKTFGMEDHYALTEHEQTVGLKKM